MTGKTAPDGARYWPAVSARRMIVKLFLWLYAIAGTLYFVLYATGFEPVVKYAVGPLWLIMMIAPAMFALLLMWPIIRRFGSPSN